VGVGMRCGLAAVYGCTFFPCHHQWGGHRHRQVSHAVIANRHPSRVSRHFFWMRVGVFLPDRMRVPQTWFTDRVVNMAESSPRRLWSNKTLVVQLTDVDCLYVLQHTRRKRIAGMISIQPCPNLGIHRYWCQTATKSLATCMPAFSIYSWGD
jgi:hypothetical protein